MTKRIVYLLALAAVIGAITFAAPGCKKHKKKAEPKKPPTAEEQEKSFLDRMMPELPLPAFIKVKDPNSGAYVKKIGFIGADGKVVIDFKYDNVSGFYEGLSLACNIQTGTAPMSQKCGYIDKKGVMVIPQTFAGGERFSEGLAPVAQMKKNAEGKDQPSYGFIDKSGKIVIAPQYDYASYFTDDRAVVVKLDMKNQKITCGFIDKTGKMVVPYKYAFSIENPTMFNEGLAQVAVEEPGGKPGAQPKVKWGYIDKDGNTVIAPQFEVATFFIGGTAFVGKYDPKEHKMNFTFINKDGKQLISTNYLSANPFMEGLAGVCEADKKKPGMLGKKCGFIDREGKLVIPMKFDDVSIFTDGLSVIGVSQTKPDGSESVKFGYIDKTGNVVIKPEFDQASYFIHGMASVMQGDKRGFIDKSGKFIWSTVDINDPYAVPMAPPAPEAPSDETPKQAPPKEAPKTK